MSFGNGAKFSRQVGTGLLGFKDIRDTCLLVPQASAPPVIMTNWSGDLAVVVVLVVVLVEVLVVLIDFKES